MIWESVNLGSVCEVVRGGSPRPIIDYITEDEEGVNWLKIGDVNESDKYFRYTNEKIKPSGISKTREVVAGDLILSNSMSFGRAFITLINGYIHDGWLRLRPNEKVLDKDYLYYFLTSNIAQNQFKAIATGSVVNNLKSDTVKAAKVFLPPIKIQKKIADYLNAIDEKIELNKAINNNLEQQTQAIFKSWFVDFEPYNGVMPSDWHIGTIDDLAKEVVCGKTPSTKNAEYYGSDVPFITIPDMHAKIYAVTTERYLSSLGANSQAKKTLPKNSVCVSCIGTAGLVTLVAKESQTNQQINSIIPKEGFSPYFIYLLMQTLSDTINKLGQSGSTIVNLNKSQFGKIQVIIPSLSAMTNFDKIISPIFEKILQNQRENINLESLRDTLLPKLMSGELDVSDINL